MFEVNLISKNLQKKTADIGVAVNMFNKCLEFLRRFREKGFIDSIIVAKEIAEQLEIERVFPEKRFRKKKSLFLSESGEEVQVAAEDMFYRMSLNFLRKMIEKNVVKNLRLF